MNYCLKCKKHFKESYFIIDDYIIDENYCYSCSVNEYDKLINILKKLINLYFIKL